jgi:hypothetical protein
LQELLHSWERRRLAGVFRTRPFPSTRRRDGSAPRALRTPQLNIVTFWRQRPRFFSISAFQFSAFSSKPLQNRPFPPEILLVLVLVLVLEISFKKKSKKMLTPALLSGRLTAHTVTTEQQHNIK